MVKHYFISFYFLRYIIEFGAKNASVFRAAKTIILQSCDEEKASEDTIVMRAKQKDSISVTYCAAINSNMTNCCNQTGSPGINLHHFSKDKLYRRSGFGLSEFTGKISFP